MYDVVVEVLSIEFVIVVVLLVFNVWFRCGILFCLLVRFVFCVIVIKVFEVLNKLINKKVKIIVNIEIFNVVVKFSCIKVGVIEGGIEIIFWYFIRFKLRVIVVINKMLISMLFFMLWYRRVVIIKKLKIVSKGLGVVMLFNCIKVVGFVMIILVFFNVISVKKVLIFVVIVCFNIRGIVLMIYFCILNRFKYKKI